MTGPFHTVVWLDQVQARIFHLFRDRLETMQVIDAPAMHGHIHHKAGTPGPGHNETSRSYLHDIAMALAPAQEILIAGPAAAKFALKRYLEETAPQLATHVIAVEALDHMNAHELHEVAQRIFRKTDLMGGT